MLNLINRKKQTQQEQPVAIQCSSMDGLILVLHIRDFYCKTAHKIQNTDINKKIEYSYFVGKKMCYMDCVANKMLEILQHILYGYTVQSFLVMQKGTAVLFDVFLLKL